MLHEEHRIRFQNQLLLDIKNRHAELLRLLPGQNHKRDGFLNLPGSDSPSNCVRFILGSLLFCPSHLSSARVQLTPAHAGFLTVGGAVGRCYILLGLLLSPLVTRTLRNFRLRLELLLSTKQPTHTKCSRNAAHCSVQSCLVEHPTCTHASHHLAHADLPKSQSDLYLSAFPGVNLSSLCGSFLPVSLEPGVAAPLAPPPRPQTSCCALGRPSKSSHRCRK